MADDKNTGVFLCTCKKELSKKIDFKSVAKAIKGDSKVVETVDNLCTKKGLSHIAQHIRWDDERKIKRVIVAACSYREKGRVFEKLLEKYNLEANSLTILNLKTGIGTLEVKEALKKAVLDIKDKKSGTLTANPELCANKVLVGRDIDISGCDFCSDCPVEAIDPKFASYSENTCTECGICLALCPLGVFQLEDFTDERIMGQMKEALKGKSEPKILFFSCKNNRGKFTSVNLPCILALSENHLLCGFYLGAEGIAILGCGNNCSSALGSRINLAENIVKAFGLENRIKIIRADNADPKRLEKSLKKFIENIKTLGKTKLNGKEELILNQGKREDLITILLALSENLGIVPGAQINEKKSYFSDLQIDREKCTGCNTCARNCSTPALESLDDKIIFTHSHCTGCKICMRICPENAISLDGTLNLEKFILRKTDTFEIGMASCLSCNAPFIPKNMLKKLQKKIGEGHPESEKVKKRLEMLKYCGNCKEHIIMKNIFE